MKRTSIGTGLILSLATAISLSGCATPPASPAAPGVPATPATTTAPAAPAEPAASRPSGSPHVGPSTADIPADHGTALAEFRLPREDEPLPEEYSAWESAKHRLTCLGGDGFGPWALEGLEASRIRSQDVVEGFNQEGVLLFATEQGAEAFMAEARSAFGRCATVGSPSGNQGTPDDPIIERSKFAFGMQDAPGVDAFTERYWTERQFEGRWVEAPGGDVTLWARKGRHVAFAGTGGEYVGDPLHGIAEGTPTYAAVVDILARV